MMRKTLLAVALMATGFTAHADYQCSVTPRDDVVLNPQTGLIGAAAALQRLLQTHTA